MTCEHKNLEDVTYVDSKGRIRYNYTVCTDCGKTIVTDGLPAVDMDLRRREEKYSRELDEDGDGPWLLG